MPEALPRGRSDPRLLLCAVWSTAADPAVHPVLRLYVEIMGQAVTGVAPCPGVVRRVAHCWLDWVHDRLAVPTEQRPDAAAALLATVDGLLSLRLAVGSDVADRAARRPLGDEPTAGA